MVAQPRNKAISPDWEKSAVSNTLAALGRLEVARGETESAATRLDKALDLASETTEPGSILAATVERARMPDGNVEAALAALTE